MDYTPDTHNTSGECPNAPVPPEIRHFNLAAGLFGAWWGFANGMTLQNRRAFFPEGSGRSMYFSPFLASQGNTLAWRYKRWPSVEAFERVQRRWVIAAYSILAFFGTGFVLALLAMLYALLGRAVAT
jgi:hypothetical protein